MQFNTRGDYTAGGWGWAHVTGRRINPAYQGTRIATTGSIGWLDDDTVVVMGQVDPIPPDWGDLDGLGMGTFALDLRTQDVTLLLARGHNVAYARGGVWAGWLDRGARWGLETSTGWQSHAFRPRAIGPDGALAYAPHENRPTRVRERDGRDWFLTGEWTHPTLLGDGRAVLYLDSATRTSLVMVGTPQPVGLPSRFWGFRAVSLHGAWWCAYAEPLLGSDTDGRVVVRPFADPTEGYAWHAPLAYGIDLIALHGALLVGWAAREGEHPEDIVTHGTATETRQPLAQTAPPVVVGPPQPPAPSIPPVPPSPPVPPVIPEVPVNTPAPVIDVLIFAGREIDRRFPDLRVRDLKAWSKKVVTLARHANDRIFRKSAHPPEHGADSGDTFAWVPPHLPIVHGQRSSFHAVSIVRDNPHNEGGRGPNEWRSAPEDHGLVHGQFVLAFEPVDIGDGTPVPGPTPGPTPPPPAPGPTPGPLPPPRPDECAGCAALRAQVVGLAEVLTDIMGAISFGSEVPLHARVTALEAAPAPLARLPRLILVADETAPPVSTGKTFSHAHTFRVRPVPE